MLDQVIYLEYHGAEIKLLVKLGSYMETLGENPLFNLIDIGGRIHSVPCGFKTEVPISLMVVRHS